LIVPLFVSYRVHPIHGDPIILAGAFRDGEHFDLFVMREQERSVYKQIPFELVDADSMSQEEYDNVLSEFRGEDKKDE
jgi:hypothetical protein